ncbi:MAG: MinD/ParA family ATP-binding protein, partial [Promethearchaeota archaeon]
MSQSLSDVKKISVTGGKGGTGKTLIAVNLAVYYAQLGYKVLLIDADVENPNSNILLGKSLTD